jgi:transcriptional regulator with XRE-family HTH domain
MHLQAYLEAENIPDSVFAKRVGVAQSTILRLKRGERKPSLDLAQRIYEATNRAVPPSEWFDAAVPREGAAA